MKKFIQIGICLAITNCGYAQLATTFTASATASTAASWLLNLNPSAGTGRIAIFKEELGPMTLSLSSRKYADSSSVYAMYNNTSVFNNGLSAAGKNIKAYFTLSKNMGGNYMRSPQCFAWALIEPTPGTYNYKLTDTIVKYANQTGVHVLGTINFYSDSASECNPVVSSGCPLFGSTETMFFINNSRTGKVCDTDTARFKLFIKNLIDRYDFDGSNDMPGLTSPVLYWEIGNELDGGCANGITATEYGKLLKMTYQAIKSECSSCKVLHGGTLGPFSPSFWNSVYANYYPYFDIANIHVNSPRNASFNFAHIDDQLDWIKNLETTYSIDLKTWVTEWGIYSGSPNGSVSTPFISEESQAARYAKFYAYGLANDIDSWAFDQSGDTTSGIGSSALLNNVGANKEAKLCLYSLWLYENKFATIDSAKTTSFATDVDFSSGLIRVYKSGVEYDVAWGLSALPSDITGVKKITDIYGNSVVQNVSTLTFPMSINPVIIEPNNPTATEMYDDAKVQVKLIPNPSSSQMQVQLVNYNFINNTISLKIFDPSGKKISQQILSGNNTILEIGNWPSGIYFYEVGIERSTLNRGKFIKE